MQRVLLVEPAFPTPAKSKNHKNFLPIGLLKIATYLRDRGVKIKLVRGNLVAGINFNEIKTFNPDEIWVTSLFTYWAEYVKNTVLYYKKLFPKAKIKVGGIYASLLPKEQVQKYTHSDEVYQGTIPEVEEYTKTHLPAYDLLDTINTEPIDFQIIHTSRGCTRKCPFCGTWKIEPEFAPKRSIKNEIKFRKVVLYDNNIFMNPYVEDILQELIELKKHRKILWVESQSGFDGRILLEKPYLAKMIKKAGFRYPRIAWDWGYNQHKLIKKQVDILINAGYKSSDIFIFMLYNWDIPFEEMEKKRIKCWEWKVQIVDCRYRPLTQLYDNYNPRKENQNSNEYYIHEQKGWTDKLIKQFKKNIRQQNICVRQRVPFFSTTLMRKRISKNIALQLKQLPTLTDKIKFMEDNSIDYWLPNKETITNDKEE